MNPTPTALASLTWRKSSYSGPNGGDCVEVAVTDDVTGVRDSKNLTGSALIFRTQAWTALLDHLS
jgi:hypothetical protein